MPSQRSWCESAIVAAVRTYGNELPPSISPPTVVWLRMIACSFEVSGPALSRMRSGTATLPTSCSGAAT